jgi:hypothetical protein
MVELMRKVFGRAQEIRFMEVIKLTLDLEGDFRNAVDGADGPYILFVPEEITTNEQFHVIIPELMEYVAEMAEVIVTQSSDGQTKFSVTISPHEFRWVGGTKKHPYASVSITNESRRNPSGNKPELVIQFTPDFNPGFSRLIFQFFGKHGWPSGERVSDEGAEFLYHTGRPEYQLSSKNPQPPFDFEALAKEAAGIVFHQDFQVLVS